MDEISRRKMLTYLLSGGAVIAGSQILSACQTKTPTQTPSPIIPTNIQPTQLPSELPTETSAEVAATQSATSTNQPVPASNPDLVVARTGQPEALVRAAIAAIGGMARFVPRDGWVIIKPNICTAYHSYEYASTTNPWVVGALVKLCFEVGAKKVQVMDFPFGGSARQAYQITGIAEQVEAAGGEMVQMADFKYKSTTIENALSLNETAIYEDALQADVLINVPIAKNHGMATLTLGMKNLMGLIQNRQEIHQDFGNRLTDLSRKIKPTLTVIDAIRILVANGPTGGNLDDVRQMDTIIASPDIVAADSYGATLFGMQPNDLDYIRVGSETGLGRSDLSNMTIKEITVGA